MILRELAPKGSQLSGVEREGRGRENTTQNTTIVCMDELPTGSMLKNGGWGANHETGI